jgi:cell division protein FtsW
LAAFKPAPEATEPVRYAVSILITCVLALLTVGTVMLCSAPAGFEHNNFEKQLAFCLLGLVCCAVAACWDYIHLRRFSMVIYMLALGLLAAVLVVGTARFGARRWFNFGFMLFQPSEFAKLALIIGLAHYAEWNRRQMRHFWRGLVVPMGGALLLLGLILIEPDFGSTMLLMALTVILLLVAGTRWQPIAAAVLLLGVLLGFFIYHDPVRRARVEAMFDRETYKASAWFQTEQSMIAIGSGGVTGLGLGEGRQKMYYVPMNHTDFIFSVIGEELGLAATLPVTLAYLAIVLCGAFISWHAREPFGMYLGLGITFLLGLQAFINIGVVTGVLPNKGLALPFVSYGGSSLVMSLCSVGLLLNVARHAAEPEPAFAEPLTFDDLPATRSI